MNTQQSAPLQFRSREGAAFNEFYRRGDVAAHVVATSGADPRLVIAFPAGNSGAAVWFSSPEGRFIWTSPQEVKSSQRELANGELLRGVSAELQGSGGALEIKEAILSSVRVIRAYEDDGAAPASVLTRPQATPQRIEWRRRRLDGAPGYFLSIEPINGVVDAQGGGPIALRTLHGEPLRLRITALTGDAPLTPIDASDLVTDQAAPDADLRDALTFLSYEEKLLAGSWRFNTYFGRDTLMSLQLLAPVLQPQAFEAGLRAVLERLNGAGEVAHEEDIGEFAVLRRLQSGEPPSDAPIFDYKMIDDDFMLPIVAVRYLLDTHAGQERAESFLARSGADARSHGARLMQNVRFVLQQTRPFAQTPQQRNLIALRPDEYAGNWRDSEHGLGGGRYPYDVNAVFAPAALRAIDRLHRSGVLKRYYEPADERLLAQAQSMAEVWLHEAPPMFEVTMSGQDARAAVQGYAQKLELETSAAAALGESALQFRGVALDAQGEPLPIMHSDEAFALWLLDLTPSQTARIAHTLARPFPAGLLTDAGLVVANPAYAPASLAARFDRTRYHGAVIWSWQQAMFLAGLDRQLARPDLPPDVRTVLIDARDRLLAAMNAAEAMRGSELWSWSIVDGRFQPAPFGQRAEDETESNAAQLWSTVHLARPK